MLPFTTEQFSDTFAAYNAAIWPSQVLAFLFGLCCLALLKSRLRHRSRIILILLGLMWLWTGGIYHLAFFSEINVAAYGFAVLFLAMGAVLIAVTFVSRPVQFGLRGGVRDAMAWALLLYALVLYPLIGLLAAEGWPAAPLFGVTPCPLTLFTLGFLLLLKEGPFWLLLAVPLIWSLIGGSAALLLSMPQDWVLLFAGPAVALLRPYRAGNAVMGRK